jgi:hypothetical protein
VVKKPRGDAAKRGDPQQRGGQGRRGVPRENIPPSRTEAGDERKDVREARNIRDAIQGRPEVTNEVIDDMRRTARKFSRP